MPDSSFPDSTFTDTYEKLPDSIKKLIALIIQEIEPKEIILFGSRARGDHRENSDFDLAVKATRIPTANWARLQLALEEEPVTLYSVDLVDFDQVNNEYKKHISTEGKVVYVR